MLLWPVNPPSQFYIPPRSNKLNDQDFDDIHILDIITIPSTNIVVILTPSRVLIYNLKPMVLVAVQERTQASIDEFGLNISLKTSTAFQDISNKFLVDSQSDAPLLNPGKLVFYVITKKHFLLAYQILKNCTPVTIFREYGLPVIDSFMEIENISEEYDNNLDDDTLTVFEINRSSKVIQNGLIAYKEKSLLQRIMNNQDNGDELPVKRVELRLKIILKFDFNLIDVLGFKKFTNIKEGKYEENLIILHQNGLQVLNLVDFKLVDSTLIKFSKGFKVCNFKDKIIVVSYDSDIQQTIINKVDFENLATNSTVLNEKTPIVSVFQNSCSIALIYEKKILIFDPIMNKVTFQFTVPFSIKLCNYVNDDVFVFISTQNNIYFYSRNGNHLFSTSYEEDDPLSFPLFQYSNYSYFNDTLITTTVDGQYHIWNLWKEAKQSQWNFRSPVTFILQRDNDIMLYSPKGDSPLNHDRFPIIKLPIKSLNNYISLIRINGNLKLLATYIANKNMLLIYNLETNVWFNYPEVTIVDLQWLSNNYLVMHTIDDDGIVSLQCICVPLQSAETKTLSDMLIWEYQVSSSITINSFHVNTLSKFKPLKIKSKDQKIVYLQYEKYYKTGEIIVVTNSEIIIFDVISTISTNGINVLKKIFAYTRVNISNEPHLQNIQWAMNIRDDILLYTNDKIYKLLKLENDHWQSIELLHNVERIIDILQNKIYLLESNRYTIYDLDDLWDEKKELLTINVDEDGYPISVTPESAIIHTLDCVFNKEFSKLVIKHDIYLDKLIIARLEEGQTPDSITFQFHGLKHYKFALEKILSTKILRDEDLTEILQLVKACSIPTEQSKKHPFSDMLEIISNCLRKIEIQYWSKLFDSLKMTPRDLLGLCIEGNEAKTLGVLLLVFLNYNETGFIRDLSKNRNNQTGTKLPDIEEHEENQEEKTTDFMKDTRINSTCNTLTDEELMLRVLNVLVTSAAATDEPDRATDAWDMCFQLIRFLKELDRQNNTNLVQKALEMLC